MKLVILGATGKTGRLLVNKATQAGHEVTAFVRHPGNLPSQPRLRIVIGDARNKTDLTIALKDQDAVVIALGSTRPTDQLFLRSTQALIASARDTGLKRIIMLSTFLLAPNNQLDFITKLIRRMMKQTLADIISGEELLRQSGMNWTILYATALDRAPAGRTVRVINSNETIGIRNGIARADVAKYMLDQIAAPGTIRQSLVITTK